MEIVSDIEVGQPVCAATQLARIVDERINGAAVQEFADATSVTQESGADLGEGSAYLDDSSISFTEQSVACGLCRGTAILSEDGSIAAPRCPVSGSCELEWAGRYPENYRTADGGLTASRLVCGAELSCSALIAVTDDDGAVKLTLSRGSCEVAKRDDWQRTRDKELREARLKDPDAGIEEFDGAGSGREEESL